MTHDPRGAAHGSVRSVLPFASVLLENNPSPMTLQGTNSWIVRASEATTCVVIDPGMHDRPHLQSLMDIAPIGLILLTHGHPDHAEGARWLAERASSPVRAFDPALCLDAEPLADGELISAAGVEVRVQHSPGHTPDSVIFHVLHSGIHAVFTGDTVIGSVGTSITDLSAYLETLRTLVTLPPDVYGLPGHGSEMPDLATIAQQYLGHRLQRLEQVRQALVEFGGTATARQIVEKVYSTVDKSLWPAAEHNVEIQLEYLMRNFT